jgi:hypothetical protein
VKLPTTKKCITCNPPKRPNFGLPRAPSREQLEDRAEIRSLRYRAVRGDKFESLLSDIMRALDVSVTAFPKCAHVLSDESGQEKGKCKRCFVRSVRETMYYTLVLGI